MADYLGQSDTFVKNNNRGLFKINIVCLRLISATLFFAFLQPLILRVPRIMVAIKMVRKSKRNKKF